MNLEHTITASYAMAYKKSFNHAFYNWIKRFHIKTLKSFLFYIWRNDVNCWIIILIINYVILFINSYLFQLSFQCVNTVTISDWLWIIPLGFLQVSSHRLKSSKLGAIFLVNFRVVWFKSISWKSQIYYILKPYRFGHCSL